MACLTLILTKISPPEANFRYIDKVVNHEMIFKGSYSDFIKVYLDIYKEVGLCLILMAELFLINL